MRMLLANFSQFFRKTAKTLSRATYCVLHARESLPVDFCAFRREKVYISAFAGIIALRSEKS
jgi:hypothetical protein